MNIKSKSRPFLKWFFLGVTLIAILISPLFFYWFFSKQVFSPQIDKNDIGSIVSAYSTLIGGGFTLFAVLMTIRQQNKDRIEANRMAVLPFLSLVINDQHELTDEIPGGDLLLPKEEQGEFKPLKTIYIEIKNLGVGVAVSPFLAETEIRGKKLKYWGKETTFSIAPSNSAIMKIPIYHRSDDGVDVNFSIGFYDIIGNYYKQKVTMFVIVSFSPVNENINYIGLKITGVENPILSKAPGTFEENAFDKKRRIK